MSENMEFDSIMREITSGLTGDSKVDVKYLDEQCKKYKEHPMAMEILRACGRMVASLMPEDIIAEFAKVHGNEMKGTEKKLYSEAMGCYAISTSFDKDSKQPMSEMYFIQGQTGGKVKEPTIDELKAYAEKYGFPIGADHDVVGLAIGYGKQFLDNDMPDGAKYVFQIAYDLTDDGAIKEILDSIKE